MVLLLASLNARFALAATTPSMRLYYFDELTRTSSRRCATKHRF